MGGFLRIVGCSGMPGASTPDVDPAEGAGTYEIRGFAFAPRAGILNPITVMNDLKEASSKLEITEIGTSFSRSYSRTDRQSR